MNITPMQMYWLVMLDDIISSLIAILIICGLFFILGIPMISVLNKEALFLPIIKKVLVIAAVSAAVSILALIFIPSTKQMAAIVIAPKITNNKKVQIISNKVYDLAVEWMEELKPNKRESEAVE